MNVNFNTTLFLGPSGFRVGGIPSCNSPLFPFKFKEDEGGIEKIQDFHLEEKGDKKVGFSTISRGQRKEGGYGSTYFFAAILSFFKATEVGIVFLAGLAISASWIL